MLYCKSKLIALMAIVFIVCAWPLILPSSAASASLTPPAVHFIYVDKSKNTISLNLVNSDMSDIAREISGQAGIKVFIDETITRKFTSKFKNMPLELGIKRLLGPVSSAFIFVEEKDASGRASYRLATVKIFKSGNILATGFKEFNKGVLLGSGEDKGPQVFKDKGPRTSGTTARVLAPAAKSQRHIPRTPGAIRHRIMLAKKNLNIIRKKNKAETAHIKKEISELNRKLSENPDPEKRSELTRELGQAGQELTRVQNLNSRIIIDEERNLRELIEQASKIVNPQRLVETRQLFERQKKSKSRQVQAHP